MGRVQNKRVEAVIQDTPELQTSVCVSGCTGDMGDGILLDWMRCDKDQMSIRTTVKLTTEAAVATYKALGQVLGFIDEVDNKEK